MIEKINKEFSSYESYKIEIDDPDTHVHVWIEQKDKPSISIDLNNAHHRRGMSVRLDGMSVLSFYADLESPKEPTGNRMQRFCPFCGVEFELVSSRSHQCRNEYDN